MAKSNGLFGFSFGTAVPAPTPAPVLFTMGRKEEPEGGTEEKDPVVSLNDTLGSKEVPSALNDKKETNKAFSFPRLSPGLESPWRVLKWTEEQRTTLMKNISSYKPSCTEAARVLLLGPVGSGKSSFISSVQSVFNGRVTNRAMVGSFSISFTKKLQFYKIRSLRGQQPDGLVLCDTMGLGDSAMTGPTLHDVLSVIQGHVPEGHVFSPVQPVNLSQTLGYRKRPSLEEKIHCVAFVLDAVKMSSYHGSLSSSFQQLREHISELGIHQVALLTHVDLVCPETAQDVTNVYKSRVVQAAINQAAALLGMSSSYVVPVKNYSSELDVDHNTDVLLLNAVDHILQYADLYFLDNSPPPDCETP
ncbi:interferon-induced protein 44-like [Takifugu rubripes]|uniref:G domain-containing protein n=1 Tax=Takifugu rubripes TaxID=31033 RepID=A0A674NP24_TAKRU|nr:interferon-induced protein 44-like [Takifugu rubripes]|eukprot:XP_011613345.1 PREDICTED: interferon-induced protein 44-like [Takifugu rubripes]